MTNKKYYIGIDPGKSGAIAVIDNNSEFVDCIDMPVLAEELDFYGICDFLNKYPKAKLTLEWCQYTPTLKGKGCFTFGQVTGALYGLLTGLNRPYNRVKPQNWKKEFTLINKEKEASIATAKQLFPEANKILLKSKDGRAEALLLAEYGRRKLA